MTLRYSHLAPAHKRKAVSVLDGLLNPSPTTSHETNFIITSQSTKKGYGNNRNPLNSVVGDAGFEPATPAV